MIEKLCTIRRSGATSCVLGFRVAGMLANKRSQKPRERGFCVERDTLVGRQNRALATLSELPEPTRHSSYRRRVRRRSVDTPRCL